MNDNKPAAVILIEAAIHSLRQQGITAAYGIAKASNEQGIWHAVHFQRIIANGSTELSRSSNSHRAT